MKKGIPMVDFMNKIPGGIMLIPLLLGCALNSFCPDFLQIGGATTGVLTSSNAFLGAFFVCVGANLTVSGAGKALKVGAVVTLTKLLASIGVGTSGKPSLQRQPAGPVCRGHHLRHVQLQRRHVHRADQDVRR